jgi:hypothetical protein
VSGESGGEKDRDRCDFWKKGANHWPLPNKARRIGNPKSGFSGIRQFSRAACFALPGVEENTAS